MAMIFWVISLLGACGQVFEDMSAFCWSFTWQVPW